MTTNALNMLYVLLASKDVAAKLRIPSIDLVALVNDYCKRQTGHTTLVDLQNSNASQQEIDAVASKAIGAILAANLHILKPPAPPVPKPEPPKPVDPNDTRAIVRAECDELLKCLVVQMDHRFNDLYDKLHRLVASLRRKD